MRSLLVVEAIEDVIDWHQRGLLPFAAGLAADPRTRFVQADFFAAVAGDTGFDPEVPGRRFDAVLLDVDHSPRHVLHPSHAAFYTAGRVASAGRTCSPRRGLRALVGRPAGRRVQGHARPRCSRRTRAVVTFPNPLTGGESTNTVYVARTGP